MDTKCWLEYLKGRDHFERPRRRWECNIKVDLKELCGRLWTGLVWFRIATSGRLLLSR
jgi:hypothetical protein